MAHLEVGSQVIYKKQQLLSQVGGCKNGVILTRNIKDVESSLEIYTLAVVTNSFISLYLK